MNKDSFKKYGFIAAVVLIVAAIVVVIAVGAQQGKKSDTAAVSTTAAEPIVRYVTQEKEVYKDKIVTVEVEKEITTDIMEEGLRDMGFLVTENYWFKEVTTIDSTKTVLWVMKANSKVIMGYEGELLAGVDFGQITVSKDEAGKKLIVNMPEAKILACDLDLESFELYEEDVSRWNMISAKDYNGSLKELEECAEERALDRGILEKAADQAEVLIRSFIEGLTGSGTYSIEFRRGTT